VLEVKTSTTILRYFGRLISRAFVWFTVYAKNSVSLLSYVRCDDSRPVWFVHGFSVY